MKRFWTLLLFATVLGASQAIVLSQVARAGLGEDESSDALEHDRRAVSGVMRTATSHGSYTVYEIVAPGRTIHEYVTTGGKVFGITWQGFSHPDLTRLMGAYYAEFTEASRQSARTRVRLSHATIRSTNTVVERSGHLRDMRGRAYVQSLIPEGVSADEIR